MLQILTLTFKPYSKLNAVTLSLLFTNVATAIAYA